MRTVYTDHDNNQTIYEFDNRHRTRRVEKPDGSVIFYDYDKDDNLIYMNENGFTTYYDYDTYIIPMKNPKVVKIEVNINIPSFQKILFTTPLFTKIKFFWLQYFSVLIIHL